MPIQITDPIKDVAKINSAFQQMDVLYTRLSAVEKQLAFTQSQLIKQVALAEQTSINNITFQWTGAGVGTGKGTISWAAGSIQDRKGNHDPVPSGSITGLLASTTYWLAWNPTHAIMVRTTSVTDAHSNPNNLVICSVKTGTETAATASIGGGGTDPGGQGFNRKNY